MRTALFALTAALAFTTPAHALSCADWDVLGALPADGTLGVPTNARVAVQLYSWYDDQQAPFLLDAEGNNVDVTVETHDAGSDVTFFLVPTEPLAAGDYTVHTFSPWDELTRVHVTGFTVSDGEDLDAPLRPTVNAVEANHDRDEWGDWYDISVEMPDEDLDENGVMYEWTVHDLDAGETYTRYTFWRGQALSNNPCSDDVAATIPQRHLVVDITAIDVAGNASEEPVWECGTGCSVTGSAPIGGLFVLLPLAAMRRRRNA